MRRGLENSINVVTAHLLDGGISDSPEKIDAVCATAVAAKIYSECVRYYPFVLGAQPVRMIDLAALDAAVANEGALPQPHGIDLIEENGQTVYEYPKTPLPLIGFNVQLLMKGLIIVGTVLVQEQNCGEARLPSDRAGADRIGRRHSAAASRYCGKGKEDIHEAS